MTTKSTRQEKRVYHIFPKVFFENKCRKTTKGGLPIQVLSENNIKTNGEQNGSSS